MKQKYSRQQKIIDYLLQKGQGKSADIHNYLINYENLSLITVKRELSSMVNQGLLTIKKAGAATSYTVTTYGRLLWEVDPQQYCQMQRDQRWGNTSYNFNVFSAINFCLFTPQEYQELEQATAIYKERAAKVSPTINRKELERFIIELSWKSSKIEGNTYSLLDTERLLKYGLEAPHHTKEEATIIINHKRAFEFIMEHQEFFQTLTRVNLEELHKILMQDLTINNNLRTIGVGVTGSRYRPLDNKYQIAEALEDLSQAITRLKTGYDKALLTLAGISYIQPFEDGNKRTSRLMANAILLAHNLAPLSYRSVSEEEYKEATLVFYELNSIVPLKTIFIGQYEFAANNYALANL